MTTADKFSTHDEPVWRERANFIINAKLPEDGRWEQLWSRRVSDDTFELCCIPYFLYDVALGDIVQTEQRAGRKFALARVVQPSGRYVFRAHFERASDLRVDFIERLQGLGALLEQSSATLLAIDAVDLGLAQQIADVLAAEANRGQLIYETGKSA